MMKKFVASSCFSDVSLHDHFFVAICGNTSLVGGFFNPSLGYLFLGEGFSHMVFSLSLFLEVAFLHRSWVPNMTSLLGPILHFLLVL